MAKYINMFPVELTNGHAAIVSLHQMHQGNANANRIGAIVTQDGQPVDLGGSCVASVIRADGNTVPLTGTVAGNEAYVDLDANCYAVDGPIQVFITWVSGTDETTLVAAFGHAERTSSGAVIQPAEPIPDLNQLLAEIDAMRTATEAANSAAEKSVRYDAAQELTETQMGQARTNIQAAGSQDVADLKSALYEFTSIEPITWTKGAYIGTTGSTVDQTPVSNSSWMYAVVNCSAGDNFIINAYGGNAPRAYAFVNSSNTVISQAASQANLSDYVVTAPENTAYLVVNNQTTASGNICYKGAPVANVIAPIKQEISVLDDAMLDIYDKATASITGAGYLYLRESVKAGDKFRITNKSSAAVSISTRTGNTTVETVTNSLAVNASIDVTLTQNADYLAAYIASGNTGDIITLNLKSTVPALQLEQTATSAKLTKVTGDIDNLMAPVNNTVDMWESGSITYGGNMVADSNKCRTKAYLDRTIESVSLIDTNYQLYVFGWDNTGSCVGFWRPSLNKWENDNNVALANCNYVNFAELLKKYPGYAFKLVLYKTSIDVDDVAGVVKFGHYIPELGEMKRRPLLTFIDDDGYKQSAEIWEDIMGECNIPVNVALITANPGVQSYSVTWDDVQRLKNIGFEFISHTHEHIYLGDDTLTSEQVTADFEATIAALNSHNCEPRFLVYPYTSITNANKELVRQYFSFGISLQNQLNEPYIAKDLVHRYDINSGTEDKEIDGQTYEVHKFRTLQGMKDIIDNAVLHNGWIIFMSHLRNTYASDGYYFDSDVKQLILDTVAYARSKNVEIVNVSKAFEMYRHIMD